MPERLHQRKVIRDAVRALLLGRTAASDRVFGMRMLPFRKIELPALAVYWTTEPVDPASRSTAPRYLKRTVTIAIEAAVVAGDEADPAEDQMDAIALQIEDAMHADDQLGLPDVVHDTVLAGSDNDIAADADGVYSVIRLLYDVEYETPAPDPDATPVVDEFSTADIRYDLSGGQEDEDQAHDTLTGLEE
jgi:hypothetical protein